MKALIGVDALGQYKAAVELVNKLDFSVDQLVLQHSVESVLPDGSFPGLADGGTYTDLVSEFEEAGRHALDEAAKEAGGGEHIDKRLVAGDPLHSLLDTADADAIDLIAVGSQQKGALQAMLMGSVTRGLLTASTHSFLAAKQGFRHDGLLTAVLATDHSEYSQRCVELLLQFAPKGIAKLVVLSIVDHKTQKALLLLENDPDLGGNVEMWAEDRLEMRNQALCRRFADLVPTRTDRVERGDVNHAIRDTMAAENADLLIMGAQGHGFLERMKSGSVSFHQVVAEHYPVLVLRA